MSGVEAFLSSIIYGIKEIPKNCLDLFMRLEKNGAITQKSRIYKLKDGFFIARVDISKNNTCFLKLLNSTTSQKNIKDPKLPHSRRNHNYGILQNDLILVKISKKSCKEKRQNHKNIRKSRRDFEKNRVEFVEILHRESVRRVGILAKVRNELKILDLKTGENLHIKVSQKSLRGLPQNCVFEVDLSAKSIVGVLGVLDEPKIDFDITMKSFGKKAEFPPDVLDFAKSFEGEIDVDFFTKCKNADRADLTHLPFVSIDPNDAKDFDDAIYYDGERIFVAIADVSYYVPQNSSIDKEALERGFSIYFPHICTPMLPSILSDNLCSLREGLNRLAFVWEMKIDKKSLEVVESRLFSAVIKVVRNFNYDEINAFLVGDSKAPRGFAFIKNLHKLTSKIRQKRLKNGLDFVSNEVKITLDSNEQIAQITTKIELESNKLIEECMLLANKMSAELVAKKLGGSGIYRIHDEISKDNLKSLFGEFGFLGLKPNLTKNVRENVANLQEKLEDFFTQNRVDSTTNADKDNVLAEFLQKRIITFMPKARYSPCVSGHFALGFEKYSHFTSPIRRYSDLMLHRILKEIIADSTQSARKIDFMLSKMGAICDRLNFLQNQVAKIELDFKDRKFARYFEQKIGEIFECVVVDLPNNAKQAAIARILEFDARIFLENDLGCEKFSKVLVEITESCVASGKIWGVVVDKI